MNKFEELCVIYEVNLYDCYYYVCFSWEQNDINGNKITLERDYRRVNKKTLLQKYNMFTKNGTDKKVKTNVELVAKVKKKLTSKIIVDLIKLIGETTDVQYTHESYKDGYRFFAHACIDEWFYTSYGDTFENSLCQLIINMKDELDKYKIQKILEI